MSKKNLKTALQVYVKDTFGKIRGMLIDGKPYFVGKDVAEALGYEKARNALKSHVDEEDALKWGAPTKGGVQLMTLINESGLYSLILSSKLESAKAFKRWVTSEVLPSIRETGTYTVDKKYQKWLAARQQTIETRKAETFAIKNFIVYAREQGFTGEDKDIYSWISILTNLTAGLPMRNGRDTATLSQLNIVDISENAYEQILIEGMNIGLHYTRILQQLEEWRINFINSAYIHSYINRTIQLKKG